METHFFTKTNKSIVIIFIILFILGGIGALFFTSYVTRKSPTEKKSFAAVESDIDPALLNAPVVGYESPWGYSENVITPQPTQLSLNEYHQLYLDFRNAIINRDFNTFSSIASTQKLWHGSHAYKPLGQNSEGINRGVRYPIDLETNFINNSLTQLVFNAPPVTNISPYKITTLQFFDNDSRLFDLVDPQNLTAQRYNETAWRYSVEIEYKSSAPYAGEGGVVFVWDAHKNGWKYRGETWNINKQTSRGRDSIPPEVTGEPVIISLENIDAVTSENITISTGQFVVWTNVTGIVQAVSPSSDYWSSDYLFNESYAHVFTKPGQYQWMGYITDKNFDSKLKVQGVINVQ